MRLGTTWLSFPSPFDLHQPQSRIDSLPPSSSIRLSSSYSPTLLTLITGYDYVLDF
jgi:hypothetical protein